MKMNSISPHMVAAIKTVMSRHSVNAVTLAINTGKSAATIRAFLRADNSKTISKLEEISSGIGCPLSEIIIEAERIAEIEKRK